MRKVLYKLKLILSPKRAEPFLTIYHSSKTTRTEVKHQLCRLHQKERILILLIFEYTRMLKSTKNQHQTAFLRLYTLVKSLNRRGQARNYNNEIYS